MAWSCGIHLFGGNVTKTVKIPEGPGGWGIAMGQAATEAFAAVEKDVKSLWDEKCDDGCKAQSGDWALRFVPTQPTAGSVTVSISYIGWINCAPVPKRKQPMVPGMPFLEPWDKVKARIAETW